MIRIMKSKLQAIFFAFSMLVLAINMGFAQTTPVTPIPFRGFEMPSGETATETRSFTPYYYYAGDVTNSKVWSAREVAEVSTAINGTSQALRRRTNHPNRTLEEIFKAVIINEDLLPYVLFVRANVASVPVGSPSGTTNIAVVNPANPQTYNYSVDNGVCFAGGSKGSLAGDGTGAPLPPPPPPSEQRPKVIICNGPETFSGGAYFIDEYLITHELGHLFDYATRKFYGTPLPTDLRTLRQRVDGTSAFAIKGCYETTDAADPNNIVMGIVSGSWNRGSRGWGSGPATQLNGNRLVTIFQKNSDNNDTEAAADMFLNWVYRSNQVNGKGTVNCVHSNPSYPGPGFLNHSWLGQQSDFATTGTFDNRLPGNRRHKWMHEEVKDLFQQHPYW